MSFLQASRNKDDRQDRRYLIDGLQNGPEALNLLFAGANTGKTIVRI